MSPRFAINSVPFALSANHAKNADIADVAKSIECQGCIASTQLDNDIKTILDNTLPNNTKYALSSTVGGDALKAASADSATKAIQDGSGNIITDTYLTKMDAASTYQPKGSYLTEISDSSITSEKIKNETITTDDIANNAITSAKIENKTITTEDIADSAITSAKIENKTITMDDISSGVILPRAYATLGAQKTNGVYSVTLENNKNISKVDVDSNGLYTVTINANAKLSGTNYHVQITPYLKEGNGDIASCGIMEITNKSATKFTFQTGITSQSAPISVSEGLCLWGGYGDAKYMPLNIIIFQ